MANKIRRRVKLQQGNKAKRHKKSMSRVTVEAGNKSPSNLKTRSSTRQIEAQLISTSNQYQKNFFFVAKWNEPDGHQIRDWLTDETKAEKPSLIDRMELNIIKVLHKVLQTTKVIQSGLKM